MTYCSWYEAWHTEFFVILDHFLPSYPTNNPKNPNFEKKNEEKSLCYNVLIMCYTVLEIWCVTDVTCIFFILGYFFPFYLPAKKKRKFKKNEKNSWRYYHFTVCTKKYDHIMYSSWDMLYDRWAQRWTYRWTDGQMDRWMKKSRTCEEGGAHVRIAFWC